LVDKSNCNIVAISPFPVLPGKNAVGATLFVAARKYATMGRITVTLKRSSLGKKRSEIPEANRITGSGAILNSIKNLFIV